MGLTSVQPDAAAQTAGRLTAGWPGRVALLVPLGVYAFVWPFGLGLLSLGDIRVLHMPGELFVEYQLAAKKMRPDLRVAMAAYGEYGSAYIGTERAYSEGGYETEPRSSNVAPQVERVLMEGMRTLLEGK